MKAAVGSANEDLPTEYSSVLLITHSALSNKVRVRSNKVSSIKPKEARQDQIADRKMPN